MKSPFIQLIAASFAMIALALCLPQAMVAQTLPPNGVAGPDDPKERVEFEAQKRVPPGQRLPVERYLQAAAHNRQMPLFSTRLNKFISPNPNGLSPNGLGTWNPLGPTNVGGRTLAIVVDPVDPNLIYAGAASGGVWKTTNGGQSWQPTTDFLPDIAIGSLAMDPRDRNTLYAGTGEGFYNIDATLGDGIFVTHDAGTTWTQLSATQRDYLCDFCSVNRIMISPLTTAIYAATGTGVWRSLDKGNTWTQILNPGLRSGCVDLALIPLFFNAPLPDTLLASCGSLLQSPTTATLFWTLYAEAGLPNWKTVLTEPDMGRTALALAPSQPNIVYAISSSLTTYGLHAFFKSTDTGETWTALWRDSDPYTIPDSQLLTYPELACAYKTNYTGGQGWYDIAIAVDPLDANRIWVGGIDLFRSDDGGATWGIASYWYPNATVHADQHSIVFASKYNGTTNQTMYIGNDGGIYNTLNAVGSVNTGTNADCLSFSGVGFNSLNNGYATAQFYHGTPYPDGSEYFGGTQDNGTLRGSTGSSQWNQILNGDGGYTAMNPFNTNLLYAAHTGLPVYGSIDGGTTWNPFGNSDFYSMFIQPYAMDPSDPDSFWVGGGWMWHSNNQGHTFVQASTQIANNTADLISAIAVAPSSQGSVVAVGTGQGRVCVNSDAIYADSNTTWPCNKPIASPYNFYLSSVAFDPLDGTASVLYATYSYFTGGLPHVYKSLDQGQTWSGIDGSGSTGIPDVPVHTIMVDPMDSQRLYVGTDTGVYVSLNQGLNWALEDTGFANVVVDSLRVDSSNTLRSLYAFTHGRGAWSVPLPGSVCSYTVTPTFVDVPSGGESFLVNVAAEGLCPWQAVSKISWIGLNRSTGSGSSSVAVTVYPNPSNLPRFGSITVAGQTVAVSQQ